jgi:hypothetical protein
MYYWDGQSWVSTLSADGRHRWNGTAWVPMEGQPYIAAPSYAMGTARQPTSWTRPLQYAVTAWYVWSAAYILSTPFWMGGMMSQIMNQSFQRQEQLNPNVTPPPPGFTDMMSNITSISLWFTAVVYVAIFAVIVVGALKRWTWMFYVVLVLLGISALLLPADLVYVFTGGRVVGFQGLTVPTTMYLVSFFTGIPGAALFVWMLIALIKRGPWAMKRVSY